MKRLLGFIAALLVLGVVVPGCGGAHRYDSRLTAADSLMRNYPDSALAMLEALPTDSLSSEGDRAYRDLLLTQARYKAYIPATSDSDITRALAYYRAHPSDQEKLTRAYLYKGAVMEELSYPDSAMFYYKQAEANSDTNDHAIIAQINIRIGSLYRNHYADFQTCFEKYAIAFRNYTIINDKTMQQICLYNMGMCSGITHTSDPIKLLKEAHAIADELNDSSAIYRCKELICRLLLKNDSTRQVAKLIAMNCLNTFSGYINNDLFIDLADIYIRDDQIDSAEYYIGLLKNESDSKLLEQLKVNKYTLLAEIAKKEDDYISNKCFVDSVNIIADSIANSKKKYTIQQIENSNVQLQIQRAVTRIDNLKWWIYFLIGTVLILFLMTVYGAISHVIHLKRTAEVIEHLKLENIDYLEKHRTLIESKNSVIDQFVKNMLSFMQTAIESSEKDSPAIFRKRIKECVLSLETDTFWYELRNYLDQHHNNIIANIARNPKITEQDLKFIELSCCGFNYLEIAIALEYAPQYISKKRDTITKKLGLRTSLQEYLDTLISKA